MIIHWTSLLAVFVVSLGSAVAVVVLLALALVGLSARSVRIPPTAEPIRRPVFSPIAGTAVAAVCLSGAGAIVLLGLWAVVVR